MASAPQIQNEVIEQFCADVQEPLERAVRKFCDDFYEQILVSLQDYLRDNAVFNINSAFDAQRREVITAYGALAAVEDSMTLREAKANAYAARKGYWTPARAEEYATEVDAQQVQS